MHFQLYLTGLITSSLLLAGGIPQTSKWVMPAALATEAIARTPVSSSVLRHDVHQQKYEQGLIALEAAQPLLSSDPASVDAEAADIETADIETADAKTAQQQAIEAAQSALEVAQESGEPVKIYNALNQLVEAYINSAQFHSGLALRWQEEGNYDLAEEQFALADILSQKSIESALDVLEQAPEIQDEATVDRIHDTVITAYHQAGRRYQAQVLAYFEAGEFESAEAVARKTIDMWETELSQAIAFGKTQQLADQKIRLAVVHNFLSQVYAALAQYEKGIKAADAALNVLEETNAREMKISALTSQFNYYFNLAEQSYQERNYDQALRYSTQALDITQQMLMLSEKSVQIAGKDFAESDGLYAYIDSEEERQEKIELALTHSTLAFHQLAQAYAEQDNHEKAIEYRNKAIEIYERLGQDDQVFSSLKLTVFSHSAMGQYSEALAIAAEAEKLAQTLDDPATLLSAKTTTATVYDTMGRYIEATERYEEALVLAEAQNQLEEADTIHNNLAVIATAQGRYAAALDTFNASVELIHKTRQQATEATTWEELGAACSTISSPDYADLAERSAFAEVVTGNDFEQQRQVCLSSTWDSELKSLSNIANVYTSQGHYQDAIETYQEALAIAKAWSTPSQEGDLLDNLGIVHFEKGNYPEALRLSQEALAIFQDLDEPINIAFSLNSIGVTYWTQGEYGKALSNFEQVLEILEAVEYKRLESATYSNIAIVYSDQGRYADAESLLQQALSIDKQLQLLPNQAIRFISFSHIAKEKGDYSTALDYLEEAISLQQQMGGHTKKSSTIVSLGLIHERQGNYADALSAYQEGLASAQASQDFDDEANSRLALGRAHSKLGQYTQAQTFYQDSLDMLKRIGDIKGEAVVLTQLGENADKQSQYPKALKFYQSALALHQQTGNVGEESSVLLKLGLTQITQGDLVSAETNLQQSLEIQNRIGSQKNKADTLAGLARVEREKGNLDKASAQLQEALFLHKQLGDKDGEAAVLAQIGDLLTQQEQPELAIIFYKQSINLIEDIRSGLSGLPSEFQQSFAGTVTSTYRNLADLLIQQDRILEAQKVLDLLKVQELEDYLQNVRGNSVTASGIDYNKPEQAFLAQYQQQQESAIELMQEFAKLNSSFYASTPEDEARRSDLKDLSDQLTELFDSFMNDKDVKALVAELRRVEELAPIDLAGLSSQRDELAQLEAIILYPLILDDRIELVLATGSAEPLHRTVENVTRKQLNDTVFDFQEALRDPSIDAVAPAQKLYKWLIEPIEDDLAAADVETILYSPDGVLRYIPLAALHDGDQWIAERFEVNNITSKSLENISKLPDSQAEPRVIAGAFADPSVVYPVGDYNYRGLPFAGQEVESLTETVSLIKPFFDQDFSFETVELEASRANILHLATHASFVSTDPSESFILFGDGGLQTVEDILKWEIPNIDLVVLSACETGLGDVNQDGKQILGLGYQFQTRGANAVIASLWPVNDGSTQILMNDFYKYLDQGMHKNKAIQKAQLAMIESDLTVAEAMSRSGLEVLDTETGEPVIAATGKINHPHYWAPFILIGNGL